MPLVFNANTTFTTATYFNFSATNATPTPPRGRDMPITRDAHGRFASSREKTPVTTVQEAADTLRHLTTIMNEVAVQNRLCSQFGISVTRAVGDTPGVKFETPNVPEFSMTWSIAGRVLTPVGADIVGPNTDLRRERASTFLREEFRAWARGHDLDPRKGSTWLAWVDTLPDDRKSYNAANTLGQTGTSQYAEQPQEATKVVTFVLPGDPVPPPPPGLDRADPVIRPFQVGDHVIRVSETHSVTERPGYNFHQESDQGMTAVISGINRDGNVQVTWDNPKGARTSRIASTDLRRILPAEPDKAPDTPESEPEPVPDPAGQVFAVGDRVLVLPSASQRGSETDRRYSPAFNRGRDGDLIAEVTAERPGGEGYEVQAVSGYPSHTAQTVATADLRPAPVTADEDHGTYRLTIDA